MEQLLGLESDDIDVALDDHTGAQFVDVINAVLVGDGAEAASVGIIKRNPEQSKHLETATMMLYDRWIDFVNLRSETYDQDSRIPDKVVRPATPAPAPATSWHGSSREARRGAVSPAPLPQPPSRLPHPRGMRRSLAHPRRTPFGATSPSTPFSTTLPPGLWRTSRARWQ